MNRDQPPRIRIARVIEAWRSDSGIVREHLSKRIGFHRKRIAAIERAEAHIRLVEALAICRELGKTIDDLIREARL